MESKDGAMVATVKLKAIEATQESFAEYGQVIEASPDGEEFGPQAAQLDLSRGIPSVLVPFGGGHVWYVGVAKASIVDAPENEKAVESGCGHFFVPPAVEMFWSSKFLVPSSLGFKRDMARRVIDHTLDFTSRRRTMPCS